MKLVRRTAKSIHLAMTSGEVECLLEAVAIVRREPPPSDITLSRTADDEVPEGAHEDLSLHLAEAWQCGLGRWEQLLMSKRSQMDPEKSVLFSLSREESEVLLQGLNFIRIQTWKANGELSWESLFVGGITAERVRAMQIHELCNEALIILLRALQSD